MLRVNEIKLPLDHTEEALQDAILARLGIPAAELLRYTVFRRGYDARKKSNIVLIYTLDVETTDDARTLAKADKVKHAPTQTVGWSPDTEYKFVASAPDTPAAPRPVVIGMGPCGLFAGLILAQMGFRPIILERGKAVRERTKDTWDLWRKRNLHSESNVQFGEGGAGTFSDGKLYSQIKDPKHYGRKVLTEFVKAGAPEEILYVSKPAYRHVPPGQAWSSRCAGRSRRWAARSASAARSTISRWPTRPMRAPSTASAASSACAPSRSPAANASKPATS
jgi:uncharacterized FAD-dependent dehydrogenase